MTAEKVGHFLSLSLQRLQLEYVDMYLVHVPFGVKYKSDTEPVSFVVTPEGGRTVDLDLDTDLAAVWGAMEAQVDAGRARAIGVSNFDVSQIQRLLKVARVLPANVQVELHAYLQQKELRAFCDKHAIVVSAYAPFASPGRADFYSQIGLPFEPVRLADDEVVRRIAVAHGKTPWQILLRFLTQLHPGIVVLPKSSNEGRIRENLAVLDFKLTAGEMKELEGLDKPEGAGRTFRFEFLPG
jgi:aldehyde reductase